VSTLARPQRPLLQPPWRALCSGASKGDGDGNDGNGKPPSDDSVLEAEPVEDVEEGTYGSLVKHDQHNISTMPPVLAFPFSNRPLFPGVYQPCEVTHDGLVAALVAAKVSSNPYVAVFLPRPNPETGVAPELTNITDPSEVHEVGTLAQITRYVWAKPPPRSYACMCSPRRPRPTGSRRPRGACRFYCWAAGA
jgi:hypothetical protein